MIPGSDPAHALQDASPSTTAVPGDRGSALEGSALEGSALEPGEPTREQVEDIDAGVLLFSLVLIVLMLIPISFLLFRFGRRGAASASSRRRGTPEQVDPWVESAQRVDPDASAGDDSRATSE